MRRSALAGAHAPPHATVKDNAHPATWVAAAREHIGTAVLSDQISRDIWPNPGRPVTNKPMTSTAQRAISEHVVQRTSKGQRTADRLLDTAELLFAQKGYEATALRDIAAAANIQQPGLYKHFESKDALYRQVLQRALQPLADEMEATISRSPREASFRTLSDKLIDVLAQHPNVSMLLIRSILSPPSDRDEIGMAWVERLMDYGRRITRAAEVEPPAEDLILQIVAIFNMMFGYFWAAPLSRGLAGIDPLSPAMIERQKALLSRFIATIEQDQPDGKATAGASPE